MVVQKSKEYTNFYENMKEAIMRLQYTIVMYDGEPYHVLCLDNHKGDDIFRIYLDPIGGKEPDVHHRVPDQTVPYELPDGVRGIEMDRFMENNKSCGLLRKTMNSPAFNKFRPFPLGMCNFNGNVYYLERQPQRHTQQGLTSNMVMSTVVSLDAEVLSKRKSYGGTGIPCCVTSDEFRRCILSDFPPIAECLDNLFDPSVTNDGVAFDRNFALLRGPIGSVFLAYKGDVVGMLPRGDTSSVRIARQFAHTKEVIQELAIFEDITIK